MAFYIRGFYMIFAGNPNPPIPYSSERHVPRLALAAGGRLRQAGLVLHHLDSALAAQVLVERPPLRLINLSLQSSRAGFQLSAFSFQLSWRPLDALCGSLPPEPAQAWDAAKPQHR